MDITLLIAAWTDWRKRKIYNKLLGPAFLAAFSLHAIQQGWLGIRLSLIGSVVGLALLLIPYLMGGIGAGDVKLLGVIGAFGGVHFVINSFFYGAVIGGIVSVYILIRRHALAAALKNFFRHLIMFIPLHASLKFMLNKHILDRLNRISDDQRVALKEKFPYGLALVAGSVLACLFPLGWC
jgi:prepilin peptidase CpaA